MITTAAVSTRSISADGGALEGIALAGKRRLRLAASLKLMRRA